MPPLRHAATAPPRRRSAAATAAPSLPKMADRDEEQILYDTIAEGSSQYWNKEEGNEDPNQYLNEERNVERDVEGNEEEEASGSQPSAGQKRARGQRGAAKKLEGRHIITEVDEDGRPSAPAEVAKKYIRHNGWVVRDNVPISTVYWRRTRARGDHENFVPDSEKEMLWTTMLETFTLPAGTENIVKSFKGDLYQKYILKGLTPNFNTFPKLRDHWDEFVAYKAGQQGQAMMDRNKENATKKKYHHHLGSGGYSIAMPKWEEMEASLVERGIEPATGKWPDRSKFWCYAHGGTLNLVDGSLAFSDQIRKAASRLTDAVEASSQGTFRPDREKEGKGSRMRSKRDTEAKIADLEYRISSYELSMQEEVARKVDERMATHRSQDLQPYIPPAMVSPSGNRSSCASTGQVASGMAIPTDPSGTYHCRPIPAGYSKVKVELVQAVYEDLELDYPGGGVTPPQAVALTHPQAPRPAPFKSRSHQAPPPARTRATKKAKVDAAENKPPPYDCMQEELDAYVAAEVKRQLKPRSSEKKIPIDPTARKFFRGMSAPAKEAIKLSDYERTLKKTYSGKSKPVPQLGEQPNQEVEPLVTGEEFGIKEFISDTGLTTDQLLRGAPIPKAEVKYKYELGKPLVKPEQLQSLPTQMYKFHKLYMEMSDTGREMIRARYSLDQFQGYLRSIPAGRPRRLYYELLDFIQRARWRGVFDNGFIDPRKVNVSMIDKYPQATEDNLVYFLKAQHYKTFHWVLLLFDLEACIVNVYDSMDKKESTFDQVFELIGRAWYRFHHLVHGNWKEKLRRKFKFPCAKQEQGTNSCSYYVCEYCHCLAYEIITTRELDVIRMRDNLTHKEFIAAVQEQLMEFINEKVLDPKGEFYYDGNTIHRSLASEITTTTSKS
uniref:OSJNBa0035B13.8 protein n=1 Tax=Oryza sativa subsp. japonica TaxID=39947 RepID=Q7XVU3_ORYSJ|nr:OSJNBa0035B13.8 [Oryza sativa Japonica Group]